jgi:translation initiation factor 1
MPKKMTGLASMAALTGITSSVISEETLLSSPQKGQVYSTDRGRTCPDCGIEHQKCVCKENTKVLGDGKIIISRQTKGRKGKGVTLISGLALNEAGLQKLAKNLKKISGVGGSVKSGIIELQGEQRHFLLDELAKQGYNVKVSGG